MSGRGCSARTAEYLHERIARLDGGTLRARLIGAASAVNFAGGNTGDPQTRAFLAPDWPIAIPDMGRCTGKGLPGGNHGSGEKCKHFNAALAQCAAKPKHAANNIERSPFKAGPTWEGGIVAED